MTRRRAALLLAAAGLAAAIATAAAGPSGAPAVSVVPSTSQADRPVDVRVSGLAPRERVTVSLRSRDAVGRVWTSAAPFRADSRGVLDLDRAPGRGATYRGVWPMGLVVGMTPAGPGQGVFYRWPHAGPARFALTVRAGGRVVASSSFERVVSRRPLLERQATVAAAGFYGAFLAGPTDRRRTAVLVFGGSEGGLSTTLLAAELAANGFPALALAYFDAPGLPPTLTNIPLEYFEHALAWLARRPEVDPRRIVVAGISRGSEAALLLGAYDPAQVHGVMALVPGDAVNCGIAVLGETGCLGPSWTLGGKAFPYAQRDGDAALIPVERIRVPLLLACGDDDAVWTSCAYAGEIADRMREKHDPVRPRLYAFPYAGHGVGSLLPYLPGVVAATGAEDERAREGLWPHVLAFLRDIGG